MPELARSGSWQAAIPALDDYKITGNLDGILTVSLSAGGLTLVAAGTRRQLLGMAEQIYGSLKNMEPGK